MTKICGIACVRDSDQMLVASLKHLALNGIRDFYLYDHGSDLDLLTYLSTELRPGVVRLQVLRKETEPFYHRAMVTALAELARMDGFEVAVAFDVDEFWCSTVEGETLADRVAAEMCEGVDALRVPVSNYVQHHSVDAFQTESLLSCRYAVVPWIDPAHSLREQVDAGRPFVAMPFPSKVMSRLSPDIRFTEGEHNVTRTQGNARIADASGIVVRHLTLPSREALAGKREHGLRRISGGYSSDVGWQLQRLAYMTDDELDVYWRDNSWRLADDQRVLVGEYDGLIEDDALPRIARDLAGAEAFFDGAQGLEGDGRPLPEEIPAERLECVVQSLVDDLGSTEQAAQRRLEALQKQLGNRLEELQNELDERTRWALALQHELTAIRSTFTWRVHRALEDPKRAWNTIRGRL